MYQEQYDQTYRKLQTGKWNVKKRIGLKELLASLIGAAIGSVIWYKMQK